MAELSDLRAKLEQIRNELPETLKEVATSVSMAGKALAERTIKDRGFGEMYSNTKVPAWFLTGKELNAAGSAFTKRKIKAKEKTNWKEFREAQGLQTGHVDLTFSGKMWAGMFPGEVRESGGRVIAPLGHNNREGQDEMNWNRDRYGDFIGKVLTGENYERMAKIAVDETIRLIAEKHKL